MDQAERELLTRIADALDRLAPNPVAAPRLDAADAFVWHPVPPSLTPVPCVARVAINLILGVDHAKALLMENTLHFASGLPANNAMLWGARGMGKSSLIKAVHAAVNKSLPKSLVLIEIHREDIASLPALLDLLRGNCRRFLIFCDDLSFEREDADYKALKSVLDGGIEGRPDNVLFYATSNRRHLMPRDMIENERATAINPSESTEEKVSLSDRFGLWVGFHNCDQANYLAMIDAYASHFSLPIRATDLHAKAIEWSITRGARSGRVAWQCIQDIAGRLGVQLATVER